jgi:hypothetical protein
MELKGYRKIHTKTGGDLILPDRVVARVLADREVIANRRTKIR